MGGSDQSHVLYVDDDEQNLFLFRTVLSSEPSIVHTALSGREALEILAENTIHVLFVDQRMPEMSGTQLLEQVSRLHPDTIRVLVTGYSDVDVVIDAINRGSVYRYISKPWSPEEIITTIRNALELHALRSANLVLMRSLDARNRLLLQRVNELSFLNDLMLAHRELNSLEDIVQCTIGRLQGELKAEAGFWYEQPAAVQLRLRRPEGEAGAAAFRHILKVMNRQSPHVLSEGGTVPLSPEEGEQTPELIRSGCILILLPLKFREKSYGILGFLTSASPECPDLLFSRAAANVTAASLYSQNLHQEELAREKYLVLGRMASMIVHDLKGPMSTIKGFVNLLTRDNLPPAERQECGGVLQQEVERLLDMIEELLSYSRGKKHLRMEPVQLSGFLREILNLYTVSFRRAGIEVDVKVRPKEVLPADGKKLKKVLINLLDNARDVLAEYQGLRRISIRCRREGPTVAIQVANTGPEIPPDALPQLFDPFFTYSKKNGTGLGLTICRNIVEEHRGTLTVRSGPEETAFTIQLPSSTASCESRP